MLSFLKKLFGGSVQQTAKRSDEKSPNESASTEMIIGQRYMIRDGRSIPVDAAFVAWTSGDLDEMLSAATTKTNKVDRHHLLQRIVEATYRRRTAPHMRELCREYSELHLSEFSEMVTALKRQCEGVLPRVTTFQQYATLLAEDKEYEKAVEVCRTAIKYDLHDGTSSGFEGRIARILKKRPHDA